MSRTHLHVSRKRSLLRPLHADPTLLAATPVPSFSYSPANCWVVFLLYRLYYDWTAFDGEITQGRVSERYIQHLEIRPHNFVRQQPHLLGKPYIDIMDGLLATQAYPR